MGFNARGPTVGLLVLGIKLGLQIRRSGPFLEAHLYGGLWYITVYTEVPPSKKSPSTPGLRAPFITSVMCLLQVILLITDDN